MVDKRTKALFYAVGRDVLAADVDVVDGTVLTVTTVTQIPAGVVLED